MPIPPDIEMQDIAPPVENIPEQTVGPSGESHDNATSSEATVGPPPPPAHEGELTCIRKYLVQYVPVKQSKPSSSSRVTGARILTSEECAQVIFEREEEKKDKEARKTAREQKKKEKEETARKKSRTN